MCGKLGPLKYVNTAIQGGADGFMTRVIFFCNELVEILGEDTLPVPDRGNPKAPVEIKSVTNLNKNSATNMEVVRARAADSAQISPSGVRCGTGGYAL